MFIIIKDQIKKKKEKKDKSVSFGPVTYDDVLEKIKTLDIAKLLTLLFQLKFKTKF